MNRIQHFEIMNTRPMNRPLPLTYASLPWSIQLLGSVAPKNFKRNQELLYSASTAVTAAYAVCYRYILPQTFDFISSL